MKLKSAQARTTRIALLLLIRGLMITTPIVAWGESSTFNIPAQPLPAALKAFANQANMQVLYVYNSVKGIQSNAVHGEQDKHAALVALLRNTNLQAVFNSNNSATIQPANTTTSRAATAVAPAKKEPPESVLALEETAVMATDREESLSKVPLNIQATFFQRTRQNDSSRFEVATSDLNDHPLLSLVHDSAESINYTATTYRPRTVGATLTLKR